MQYSQEHLKTMVYAKFGGQTECIMGNWKIENGFHSQYLYLLFLRSVKMVMEATEKSAETILTSTAFHPLVSAVSYQTALR